MRRTRGHCMTIGSASTSGLTLETLGIGLRLNAGIAVLRENLRPDGATLEPEAQSPKPVRPLVRAVVFGDIEGLRRSTDDPALDVPGRESNLLVPQAGLVRRHPAGKPPPPERGDGRLCHDRVLQANEGADLDFRVGRSRVFVPRDHR